MAVQRLQLQCREQGSSPGYGIKIPHAPWCGQNKTVSQLEMHFTSSSSKHVYDATLTLLTHRPLWCVWFFPLLYNFFFVLIAGHKKLGWFLQFGNHEYQALLSAPIHIGSNIDMDVQKRNLHETSCHCRRVHLPKNEEWINVALDSTNASFTIVIVKKPLVHTRRTQKVNDLSLETMCVRVCSVAQTSLTLCNPMDCSPPGSSVHGILQTRISEWVAISSSMGSSQPRDGT